MLTNEQFYRIYTIRRIMDLDTIIDLDTWPEMPRFSIVHCLDNLYKDPKDLIFVPNDNGIIINKEPPVKFYNVVTNTLPAPTDVIANHDDGIKMKPFGTLASMLNAFRRNHNRMWRMCTSPLAIPERMDVLGIVSYNPIFNVRIAGLYPQVRFINYILASVINTIASMKDMNRPQFLVIPIQNKTYDKQMFIKALEYVSYDKKREAFLESLKSKDPDAPPFEDVTGEITDKVIRTLIRLPDDPFYLILLHWLCFISAKSSYSLFEYIPKKMLHNLYITFTNGKKSLTYSILDMMKFNGSADAIIIRLIRQMNALAISNDPTGTNAVINDYKAKSEKPVEKEPEQKFEPVGAIPSKVKEATPETKEEPSTTSVANKVEKDTGNVEVPNDQIANPSVSISEIEDIDNVTPIDKKIVDVNPEPGKLNAPNFKGDVSSKELEEFVKNSIAEMGELTKKNIKADIRLTPAQKTKIAEIAEKWHDVKLDDTSLSDLILKNPPSEVADRDTLNVDKFTKYGGDPSMADASAEALDRDYLKRTYKKDIASTLLSFNKNGMYLTDIKKEPVITQMTREDKYNITYVDNTRKQHHIKFSLPIINEYGSMWINGSEKRLRKQRVSLPICKVSPTRVTLNASLNKAIVERNAAVAHSFYPYFLRLVKASAKPTNLNYGFVDLGTKVLPYEYTQLARHHPHIDIDTATFFFDYDNRYEYADNVIKGDTKALQELEKDHGVLMGNDASKRQSYFMKLDGTVSVIDINSRSLVSTGSLLDYISDLLEVSKPSLNEWVDIDVVGKQLPVGFILCYRFGLLHMLKYLKTAYKIYPRRVKKEVKPSDIVIDFADYSLVIGRTPYVGSLIFSGLTRFNTKTVTITEMESKDIYYDLLQSAGFSLNCIKGIDTFFDYFIDPITADVLKQMHEPTNFKDLVIRAVALLSTEDHANPSSSSNYRIRGYELLPALMYNEIARALDRYSNKSIGAGNKFSISPEAIKNRFLSDQLVSNTDGLNPLQDLRERTQFSHTGFGGRGIETFMLEDRKFTDDSRGIISEATVAGGAVAVVAGLSMDPNIINTRGMTESKPAGALNPAEMLSSTSLLLPGVTQDDGKRAYMAGLQTAQYMPTVDGEVSRIRTGYEHILAYRSKPPYAFAAKQDGKIIEVNDDLKTLKVVYEDGTEDIVQYGDRFTRNSSSGFYNTNRVVVNNFKLNDKFKKGDILAYNKDTFKADPYSKQVDWKIGAHANVALVECDDTLSDCSAITTTLAKKLGVIPVHPFVVQVPKFATVYQMKDIGEHVQLREPIAIFNKSEVPDSLKTIDADSMAILQKINRSVEKSNHAGIISKIDVFYTCPVEELSESLKSYVKKYTKVQNAESKMAKGTLREAEFVESSVITTDYRIEGTVPTEDTVIFKFYIQEETDMNAGSKVVYSTELKSVVGYILPESLDILSGQVKVDAIMSMHAANARIVYSPFVMGAASRVLDKLEADVLKMYFDSKK